MRVLSTVLVGLMIVACTSSLARADQGSERVARLGFVGVGEESTPMRGQDRLWTRLAELGWMEGRNLVVERRWAEGRPDRLPGLMSELVAHNVDVIITGGTPAALAAKQATTNIPIVVISMGDAVGTGLVASLAHPVEISRDFPMVGWKDSPGNGSNYSRRLFPS